MANAAQPPPYSSAAAAATPHPTINPALALVPGVDALHLAAYRTPQGQPSADAAKLTVYLDDLPRDPRALTAYVRSLLAAPPRPLVHIVRPSSHLDVTRRDIWLDVTDYLRPASGRPTLHYIRDPQPRAPRSKSAADDDFVAAKVAAFLASPAPSKRLIVRRTVTNWDTQLLAGRVHTLGAEMKRGALDVSFPVQLVSIVITTRSMLPEWLSRPFTVYDDFELESVWPYADVPGGTPVRLSEGEWWSVWGVPVRAALHTGKCGWIGREDLIDSLVKVGSAR